MMSIDELEEMARRARIARANLHWALENWIIFRQLKNGAVIRHETSTRRMK